MNRQDDRKLYYYYTCTFVVTTLSILGLCSSYEEMEKPKLIWVITTFSLATLILCDLLIRLWLVYPEWTYSQDSKTVTSTMSLFKKNFTSNTLTYVIYGIVSVNVLIIFLVLKEPLELLKRGKEYIIFIAFAAVFLLFKICDISNSPRNLAMFVRGGHGLDYGSGMAYNYFYGYLDKILPHRGDANIGIKENIERYESVHGVEIAVPRLFILIPTSMYCPPSLDEIAPRGIVESRTPLDKIIRDVAGVKGREYHNSVYSIRRTNNNQLSNGTKTSLVYVVAEGATPLLTYFKAINSGTCTAEMIEHRLEIIHQFYETLKRILDSTRECKGTCELVYYNDLDKDGNSIENFNIADVLLEKIDKIKSS